MTAPFRRLLTRPITSSLGPAFSAACLAALLALGTSESIGLVAPAQAQSSETRALIDRIDRLQREMNTLQRQVYKGEPPPAPAVGGSAQPGGMTTTAAARIELRLSQLETQLRTLTGQVEEAVYFNTRLQERLERLAAEVDMRLQRIEPGAPPLAAGQGTPGGQLAQPAPGGAASPSPSQPRTLGTVSQSDLQALQRQKVQLGTAPAQPGQGQTLVQSGGQQAAAATAPAVSNLTPEQQYQHAFSLLSQANYGEAERALRRFVEQNPSDPLAGNAKYWLGETYYVRQDYQQAAVTFAEAYQEYPNSGKAPDNLLKLGMALSALGSTADACGTYAELVKRYPKAAVTVIQRANQERQRLACP